MVKLCILFEYIFLILIWEILVLISIVKGENILYFDWF